MKFFIEHGINIKKSDGTTDGIDVLFLLGISRGRIDIVKSLIENGVDINARNFEDNLTALIYSVWISEPEPKSAELLIKSGADVNAKNADGETALMYAVKNYLNGIATLLIEYGADVNAKTNEGKTALMYAAEAGNLDGVKLLLSNNADTNLKDNEGKTAIDYAQVQRFGSLADIKMLSRCNLIRRELFKVTELEKSKTETQNAMDIPEKNQELLNFSLLSAIERGNIKDVEELLAEGANVNARICESNFPTKPFFSTCTALIFAINQSHYNIAKLLAQSGADMNEKDEYGNSALTILFSHAKYRYNLGNITIGVATILSIGGITRGENLMKFFLEQDFIDVKTSYGTDALFGAIVTERLDILELLIQKGVDINARKYNNNRTALMHSINKNKAKAAELLIKSGASVNAKTYDGETALMYAVKNYLNGIATLLIEHGANVNTKTHEGKIALMFAAEAGNLDGVKLLIANSADAAAKDYSGKTAADYAEVQSAGVLVDIKLLHRCGQIKQELY